MSPHRRYTPDISRPSGSELWRAGLRGSRLIIAMLLCALALTQSLYAANDDDQDDLPGQPPGTETVQALALPRFAFALSKFPGWIYGFTTEPTSGRLEANGSFQACQGPVGLAVDGTSQWLYVACSSKPFQIAVLKIDAAGHLALQQSMPVTGAPIGVAVHPNNGSVYVTKSLPGSGPLTTSFTLQRYTRNQQNGRLTFAEEQPSLGADPFAVALTPKGNYAFVANLYGNSLRTFRINPISGQMMAVGYTRTCVSPTSLSVTPQGDLLIVGCVSVDSVSKDGVRMYAIHPTTGALTLVDHRGVFAAGVGVSPDGNSAIVSYWDDKTVARYTIDHAAKKLVLRQIVADTGGAPSIYNGSVVFNLNGESFYVVNVYDSTGSRAAGNVQRYTIDHATGAVMPQKYASAGYQPVALAIVK